MPQPPDISKSSAFGAAISGPIAELVRAVEDEAEKYASKREEVFHTFITSLQLENNDFRVRLELPKRDLSWPSTLETCSLEAAYPTQPGYTTVIQEPAIRIDSGQKKTSERQQSLVADPIKVRTTMESTNVQSQSDQSDVLDSKALSWSSDIKLAIKESIDSPPPEADPTQDTDTTGKKKSQPLFRRQSTQLDRNLESHEDKEEIERLKQELDRGRLFGKVPMPGASTVEQIPYDVSMYYHKSGVAQAIANSEVFEKITLIVIFANAVYIGIDADHNESDNLHRAKWGFQVCENLFCIFFSFELADRFLSFQVKLNCLKDAWFKFDACLVLLMILETWFLPVVLASGTGAGATGLVKLLRLLRIARMARLMRAFPELVAMVKGVKQAGRAVGSALMLLMLLVYVFSILLYTLLKEEQDPNVHYRFKRLGVTMWTLLVDGSFMDGIGWVSRSLLDADKYLEATVFMVFVLGSALTVMNMLIGVLCEVVSAVAACEKEDNAIKLVRDKLLHMLRELDQDGSNGLSRSEIGQVLENTKALAVLSSLQVNAGDLMEQLDMFFEDNDCDMSIAEIMDLILMLRGDRTPLMSDILHGHHFNRWKLEKALTTLATHLDFCMKQHDESLREVRNMQREWSVVPSSSFFSGDRGQRLANGQFERGQPRLPSNLQRVVSGQPNWAPVLSNGTDFATRESNGLQPARADMNYNVESFEQK